MEITVRRATADDPIYKQGGVFGVFPMRSQNLDQNTQTDGDQTDALMIHNEDGTWRWEHPWETGERLRQAEAQK